MGEPEPVPDPLFIRLVSGDHQAGLVFTALREELVVQVENQRGEPVSGVTVRFNFEEAPDLASSVALTPVVVTDADGRAASVVVLGDVAPIETTMEGSPPTRSSFVSVAIDDSTSEPAVFETTTVDLFSGHFNFTEGTPESAGLADFDGDTRPDLFFVRGSLFSAALNTVPAGSSVPVFGDLIDLTLATNANAKVASIADLDGDGKTDLAISLPSLGMVAVLINQTAAGDAVPSFTNLLLTTSSPTTGTQVAIADLDSDGKLDLVVPNASTIDVFRNTSVRGVEPSFERSTVATIGELQGCTTADLDKDGRPDLVVTSETRQLSLLQNTTAVAATTPTFAASIELATTSTPSGVASGDLDGDGKVDLVVRQGGAALDVFTNTSSGGSITMMRGSVSTLDSPTVGTPLLVDINQDGRLDIVIAALNGGANHVSILFGSPIPGIPFLFKNYVVGGASDNPSQPAAGDLDGDGRLDLVLTNSPFNRLAVFVQGQ